MMSKLKKLFFALFCAVVVVGFQSSSGLAQDLAIDLKVSETLPSIEVNGEVLNFEKY